MAHAPNNYIRVLSFSSLILVVFVILWGAFVRASGSGAGCGAHWPLCNGQIIIKDVSLEKFIEFFHRITSGLSFILVFITYLYTRKNSKHPLTKKSAFYSFVFICTEALIGAGLVLFGWVKDDSSASRAFVVAGHLINSFVLLFSLAVLCYLSLSKTLTQNDNAYSISNFKRVLKESAFPLFLFIIVSSFGAVTALGDTIFPSTSLIDGLHDDFSISSHFLIKLRVIHPLLALYLAAKLVTFFTSKIENSDTILTSVLNKAGIGFLILQVVVGCLNILLLAPTYLQISHLAVGVLLWLTFSAKICAESFQEKQ